MDYVEFFSDTEFAGIKKCDEHLTIAVKILWNCN